MTVAIVHSCIIDNNFLLSFVLICWLCVTLPQDLMNNMISTCLSPFTFVFHPALSSGAQMKTSKIPHKPHLEMSLDSFCLPW